MNRLQQLISKASFSNAQDKDEAIRLAGDDKLNADRYRKLREMTWDKDDLFVVVGGKDRVKLGTDCPSGERLDEVLDAATPAKNEGT